MLHDIFPLIFNPIIINMLLYFVIMTGGQYSWFGHYVKFVMLLKNDPNFGEGPTHPSPYHHHHHHYVNIYGVFNFSLTNHIQNEKILSIFMTVLKFNFFMKFELFLLAVEYFAWKIT